MSAYHDGGYLLHLALREFGFEAFEFAYIAAARSRRDLNELETILIRQYEAVEKGYNQTRGGSAGESVGQITNVGGQHFISVNAAARSFGISEATVHQRLHRYGWSVDQAFGLTAPPKRTGRSTPFVAFGSTFSSFRQACQSFGLSVTVVRGRLKVGWTLEQAFGQATPPRKGRNGGTSIAIGGVSYSNITEASHAFGVEAAVVAARLRRGWSPEESVGLDRAPARSAVGMKIEVGGTSYGSIAAACRSTGMRTSVVNSRLKLGWTTEQAFNLEPPPPRSGEKNGQSICVGGVTFSSRAKAAKAHGLDPRVVHKRLNKFGWTIDEAFGLKRR